MQRNEGSDHPGSATSGLATSMPSPNRTSRCGTATSLPALSRCWNRSLEAKWEANPLMCMIAESQDEARRLLGEREQAEAKFNAALSVEEGKRN